ncbi:MAG: L,D-transpeptidase [Candidatus Promineifilaceae bacterium]|nr:L,D-transpeptidase [Candidatus Promineifilaceae bacterium]
MIDTKRTIRPTLYMFLLLLAGLLVLLFAPRMASAAVCNEQNGLYICDARPIPVPFTEPPYQPDSLYYYRSYAWMEDYAHFYDAPNGNVVEQASEGILYYTLKEVRTDTAGVTWYRVGEEKWARHGDMHPYLDSRFPGKAVNVEPDRPFGWLLARVRPFPAPDVEPPEDTPRLDRYTFVQIHDAAEGEEGVIWYDIGGGRWIAQTYLALVDASPRPDDVGPSDFWVEVDLFQQTVAAYEGDRMVYATLASTGLPRFETNEGLFTVYARHMEWDMWGGEVGDDYYYLQDVPHTLFFDDEIALHGAYWHDDFGKVRSHGCVNLPPRSAEWIYFWSEDAPGETLWVSVRTSAQDEIAKLFSGSHRLN